LRNQGSGIQGVDQLIQLVRQRLHVGLGGRIGNRQAQRREGDEARADVVEVVLDGLDGRPISPENSGELSAGPFPVSSFILSLRPPAGKSRESVRAPTASTRRRVPAAHDGRMLL
jgi:hypothetical protein